MHNEDTATFHLPEGIDWTQDFDWVQDYGQVRATEAEGGGVTIIDGLGVTWTMNSAAFTQRYMATGSRDRYKRRFQPVKAFCFASSTRVRLHGALMTMEAGDAVCLSPEGALEIVRGAEFAANYLIVAWAPTEKAPVLAFEHAA
ncbi:hypothetical protein DFR52_102909 [Hoeflea marina]|uniref:Uncharacterized protein n=1 Tax=Hoeflea marina TaxID=274592 RepID=A0A317PPM7_9HYPH|nr:hypothetical protein [Hoeflea marina]PWW02241.1 hypothetical protein DFR52_102909 [Hoeflea marina]